MNLGSGDNTVDGADSSQNGDLEIRTGSGSDNITVGQINSDLKIYSGDGDDYINCPLSKKEYYEFIEKIKNFCA